YSAWFLGLTAKAITRPEATAGPIKRNCRPLNVSAVMPPFFSSFFSSSAAGLAASAFFPGFLVLWPASSFLFSGELVCENSAAEATRSISARATVRRRYEFKEISYLPRKGRGLPIFNCQWKACSASNNRQLTIGNCKSFEVSAVKDLFFYETDMYTGFGRKKEVISKKRLYRDHRIESLAYAEEIS